MLCCISFSNDTDFRQVDPAQQCHVSHLGSLLQYNEISGQKSGNDWTNTSARDNWWQIINHHHSHRHHLKTYFGTKKENGDQLIFNFTLSSGPTLDKANRGSQTRARWWARCSGCKLQWLKKNTNILENGGIALMWKGEDRQHWVARPSFEGSKWRWRW